MTRQKGYEFKGRLIIYFGIGMRAHGARRTADDSLDADHVAVGVEQDAVGHVPVPARAPRLLVVALHRFGQTGVDHVAHVRLVDAHAEGYGGTDDLPTRYCSVIWQALHVRHSTEHNTRVWDSQPRGEPECLQCSNCIHLLLTRQIPCFNSAETWQQ